MSTSSLALANSVVALDRQTTMVTAFVVVAVAAVVVSIGAWLLLWRERRRSRR